jgi:hypothetical protein
MKITASLVQVSMIKVSNQALKYLSMIGCLVKTIYDYDGAGLIKRLILKMVMMS